MNRIAPMSELRQREPRLEDRARLALIRQLICLVCHAKPVEAAHIRYADAAYGKPETGAGRKPDDRWAVPLCRRCHNWGKESQHANGERKWWKAIGIDPLKIAQEIDEVRGDLEAGERIIKRAML